MSSPSSFLPSLPCRGLIHAVPPHNILFVSLESLYSSRSNCLPEDSSEPLSLRCAGRVGQKVGSSSDPSGIPGSAGITLELGHVDPDNIFAGRPRTIGSFFLPLIIVRKTILIAKR